MFPLTLVFRSFCFGHQLPAFLNNHCEHELWKASLHDIVDSLILLFHIFSDNFVPDKLPKLYKIFVQKQSITCIKNINVHVIYYFFTAYDI